jgi:hypothetical protein
MPSSRISIEPPRVIGAIDVTDEAGSAFSPHTTEVWSSTHGPPPDLLFLRTIILIA